MQAIILDRSYETTVVVCKCGWRCLSIRSDGLNELSNHQVTVHPGDRPMRDYIKGKRNG